MFRIAGMALVVVALSGCSSTTDSAGNYDGCHGVGCLVDPVESDGTYIDPRPQFDEDGNPNFDEHGNYIGS